MAFVVTSGQLTAVESRVDYLPDVPRGINLSPHLSMTYEQLYRTQPAVRTVIGFLARNVAQVSLDPYRRLSETDREKAIDHPIAALLDRPVPGSKWTKYRLLNTLMSELCIFDSAYWLKAVLPSGRRAIQPIPARLVRPRGRSVFAAEYYEAIGPLRGNRWDAEQVVHFHGYNPTDARTGVPPIETLRRILAEDHAAAVYREQMWRNGARNTGYLKRPPGAKWSDGARERFAANWQAQYSGDGPAAGGTPILEEGMDFITASINPRDAQYVEARKLTREEVCVAFNVPPVMFGLMEGGTVNNVTELHKMLYQDTLAPWLVQIEQDIECQLLDDLDPSAADERSVYVEFNLKAKLAGSFEEQAKSLQSAVGGPWMTRAEARAMHNLGFIEGSDQLIVPLNVIEGGLASPNDTAPDNPSNEESNGQLPKSGDELVAALVRYFTRQSKSVTSRLGAGRAQLDELLPADRWDAELAADIGNAELAADINAATRTQVANALSTDDPPRAVAALFDAFVNGRARSLAAQLESMT